MLSSSSSSGSSNFNTQLEESLPNNQLGMDDSLSELGESTEDELAIYLEQRRKAKAKQMRATKRGPGFRPIARDDDDKTDEDANNEDTTDFGSESEPGFLPTARMKKKQWHVVLFHRTKEQVIKAIEDNKDKFTRVIACEDNAPTTENIHFHIGLVLKSPTTMGGMKNMFGEDAFLKYSRNLANLFNYIRGEGKHTDFKEVIYTFNDYVTKKISTGLKQRFYEEWWKDPTMTHFEKMIQQREWMTMATERKHIKPIVANREKLKYLRDKPRLAIWISGSTGSGKSFMARHLMQRFANETGQVAAMATISTTAGQLVGLQGEEKMVLFDDIKVEKIVVQDLLQVVDQYPQLLDVKNAEANYDPDVVVVTCLNTVQDIGNLRKNWEQKEVNQLIRRINLNIHAQKTNNGTVYEVYNTSNEKIKEGDMQQTLDFLMEMIKPEQEHQQ